MTRTKVIREVSRRTGVTQKDIREIMFACEEIIKEGLLSDGQVKLFNFGTFFTIKKKARDYVHPADKTRIIRSPEQVRIKFRPSEVLMEGFND